MGLRVNSCQDLIFVTLVIPGAISLIILFAVIGFGVYGFPLTILAAILSYRSPKILGWLQSQPGYDGRIEKVLLFKPITRISLAQNIILFLGLPSALITSLMWARFFELVFDPAEPLASLATFLLPLSITGAIGIYLMYGFILRRWSLVASNNTRSSTQEKSTPREDGQSAQTRGVQYYRDQLTEIAAWRALTPVEFERAVGSLFENLGYDVEVTSHTNDEGIDLILHKDNRKTIVQCKRYKGTVGQPVVRDVFGTMMGNSAHEAYIVTTGRFTMAAHQWAKDKPIHLVNGVELIEWYQTIQEAKRSEPTLSQTD